MTEYGMLSRSGVELWTNFETPSKVDWLEVQERLERRRLAKASGQSAADISQSINTALTDEINGNDPDWTPSYDRRTEHLISDKTIADAVEALIGAYLIASGPKAALRFMAWLGVRIFPKLRLGAFYSEILSI